jgi:hypothetical protein
MGRVHLAFSLQFNLQFGACVGTSTKEFALPLASHALMRQCRH